MSTLQAAYRFTLSQLHFALTVATFVLCQRTGLNIRGRSVVAALGLKGRWGV